MKAAKAAMTKAIRPAYVIRSPFLAAGTAVASSVKGRVQRLPAALADALAKTIRPRRQMPHQEADEPVEHRSSLFVGKGEPRR